MVEASVKSEGTQPLLVFSDSGRSMGLVVDEIVDIVDDRLDIEVSSDRPGILGSAVIKGHATEIVDVGHFLPLAFEDWFCRNGRPERVDIAPCCWSTIPLLPQHAHAGAQGRGLPRRRGCGGGGCALVMKAGQRFDVVVTDIEMPNMNGFEFAEALRGNPRTADIPIIALAAMVSTERIERGRAVGFHDFVAKFDRPGLVAAVKEQSADLDRAADGR